MTAVAIADPWFLGPYRVDDLVGEGGAAYVYRAEQVDLARPVALKVLRPNGHHTELWRSAFLQEMRIAASVNHPNIAAIYDAGMTGTDAYCAMQLVEGPTLRSRIGRGLPDADVAHLGAQIADAISYLHANQIVHRDIKTENVILDSDDTGAATPYLIDFGLACRLGDRTTDAIGIGTPRAVSPEQVIAAVERRAHADTRTDVWAFGVLLYEMVTGRTPFPAHRKLRTLFAAVVHDQPRPLPGDLSSELRQLIEECLAKDPDARPTMEEARDILAALAEQTRPEDDYYESYQVDEPTVADQLRLATLVATLVVSAAGIVAVAAMTL